MLRRRFPIRLKLIVGALAPLFIAILVCWLTGASLIRTRIYRQAQDKVRTDLNSAREVYLNEIDHIRDVVKFTGQTPYVAAAIASGNRNELNGILSPLLMNERLDFLNAVDATGRVIFRTANPSRSGENAAADPLVRQALQGNAAGGTMVIPPDRLLAENPLLAGRAVIPVKATPHARHNAGETERSGMFLVSAAPVKDGNGAIVGALYGGVLLNGNSGPVDRIKRIVFEGVQFEGKNVGTATVFLGDVRIATNVLEPNGERAVGTRMSAEVYRKVLEKNEKWIGRAFVVNDWYFSAYEPIRDATGKTVGSLYVGMLEKPYLDINRDLNPLFAGVLLFGSLIGLALSGFIGSRLAHPIHELETRARRITAGERDLPIEVRGRDEIADLAHEFNEMTRNLTEREEEVRALNRELEEKVLERTAQLEEKNLLLVRTREELVRAEKLAAIGELAAGVAHEINNPLAVIRGNAELMQLDIPVGEPNREEADTILHQVGRVERIVANLLRFARQEQKQLGRTDVNRLIDEVLGQVGHQAPLAGIHVVKRYASPSPELEGDGEQLRQVFINLILNAIQAMPAGGTLRVITCRVSSSGLRVPGSEAEVSNPKRETRNLQRGGDYVEISVEDTGAGITPENMKKVFTPFFTTKSSGTGLGLSVSYGIIRDHNGSITVASDPAKGTTFLVTIPLTQG